MKKTVTLILAIISITLFCSCQRGSSSNNDRVGAFLGPCVDLNGTWHLKDKPIANIQRISGKDNLNELWRSAGDSSIYFSIEYSFAPVPKLTFSSVYANNVNSVNLGVYDVSYIMDGIEHTLTEDNTVFHYFRKYVATCNDSEIAIHEFGNNAAGDGSGLWNGYDVTTKISSSGDGQINFHRAGEVQDKHNVLEARFQEHMVFIKE